MAESPILKSDGNVKISILSEGAAISDDFRIISLLICKKVNKIPYAKLIFMDGDMPNGDFPLSNEDTFKPGKKIQIKAGYGQEVTTIFEGIVIKHGIQISGENSSQLVVELKDKAVRMTVGRKNANFTNVKDSDVITSLIGNYEGLIADIGTTSTTHKQLIQHYATDWDFLMSRAEVNGFLILIDDGTITVKPPAINASAALKISYGIDLMHFKADIDASEQFEATKSVGWSISDQKTIAEEGESPNLNSQGDIEVSELAKVMEVKEFRAQSLTPLENTSLQSWANSRLLMAGMSKIKGKMEFQGNAKAKPGVIIELERLGNRFNGNTFVSSVQHIFSDGNWKTEADFGLSYDWSHEMNKVSSLASGLLPGIDGLQVGIVERLDGDPEGEKRIQVKCPLLGDEAEALWARMSNFYGFNDYGAYFIPEIGTEVIIGFFNSDPRFPVVLGSLYSSTNKPPFEITADNFTKAIITKSKLKIELNDNKKETSIETPGGNKIVISDDEKSVLISDQNSNKIELNSSGITLDSPKDIRITSKSKISLDGTGGISMNSNADIKLSGMNIDQSANASYTAKGTASAEFSASGNTTIKGALVMIN